MRIFILAAMLTVLAAAPATAEYGFGAGGVGLGGFGALAYFQPEGSRWRLGAEYGLVASTSRDEAGRAASRGSGAMGGLFIHRQFTQGKSARWYAGAALLRWTRREEAAAGNSARDSDLSPYFGLGWWRRFGGNWFADIGFLGSPWARLDTPTSAGPGVDRGAADLHMVIGARWQDK